MRKKIEEAIKNLFFEPWLHIWELTKNVEETLPKLSFQKFELQNFKGIDKVEIDLKKNDLVLLLGLNESGKTTILKGIESFSFLNDPSIDYNPSFFQSIRKKSKVGSDVATIVTATIKIEDELVLPSFNKLGNKELSTNDKEKIDAFIYELNKKKEIVISRVFPFKKGIAKRYYYRFETDHPFGENKFANFLAQEIVNVCPFIIYFEDFKDRIPEKIYVKKTRKDSFDFTWYDIIDGLFYNTDPDYSIKMFKGLHNPNNPLIDDGSTVIKRVNKKLNDTFTAKWKDLSGVKEIEETELKYTPHYQTPYFTLKIMDRDGTTYSVDERSKGALWYLSFLMKTEFRSKKLRKHFGKPVFLIDEPASNLHSTAQHNMINDFKMLADDTSIIYTTHSQYLISLENIKNTFIIEKDDGIVKAEKWGEYLNRQDAQVSYYQPLANLLDIIPNSFDIPWQNCILTEGPSDRHILLSMYKLIYEKQPKFVIYPGTSANSLSSLITLNIGWNSKFKVLLDSDSTGNKAFNKYKKKFNLENELVQIPKSKKEIEKCFSERELKEIRDLVFPQNKSNKVSKKEIAAMWAVISESDKYDTKIKKILNKSTKDLFINLFDLMEVS